MTNPEELPITPGEAIKRYDHTHDGMMEHRVGYWVKHVDHNAAVRDLAERLEEARRLLNELALFVSSGPMHNWPKLKEASEFLTRTKQPEE